MSLHPFLRTLIVSFLLCASARSQDHLVFEPKEGPGGGKRIVLIAGDEEYRSEESCPMLAKILSQRHGFHCTVLFSLDPTGAYIDPTNQKSVSNIAALDGADLLIIGTRYRQWSPEAYEHVAKFLDAGKPVIGFRTATHAFTGSGATGDFKWAEFGFHILGERWVAHHGKHNVEGTRGVVEATNAEHPVLRGVKNVFGPSDVYTVKNLDQSAATILLRGAVTATMEPDSKPIQGEKNNPMMPLAWLREYTAPNGSTKGKAFCCTMGSSGDFANEDLRRLFVNASYHLLGIDPPAKADVTFVDKFTPTHFAAHKADYYAKRQLKVSDFALGSSAATGGVTKPTPPDDRPVAAKPPRASSPAEPVQLPLAVRPGESIALIGNSLGERMLHDGYFEAALQQAFPQARLTVRNLCNPGDTAGFRPHPGRSKPWAFPGAEKFNAARKSHFGTGHFPSPDEWLFEVKADTVVAFFGFNESFDGLAAIDNFKAELSAFVDHSLSLAYNGKTAPRLILVTPIAFENRTDKFELPSGAEENKRLAAYSQAVLQVATEKKIGGVDVFAVTSEWFSAGGNKLTINGCHLSEAGYAKFGPWLAQRIFGAAPAAGDLSASSLRTAVQDKDWFWTNDYRMQNGVHVWGQRWKPYGNVNYPEEIEKIRQMTKLRDQRIWDLAANQNARGANLPTVPDEKTRALTPVETNFKKQIEYLTPDATVEKFTVRDGFKVDLFASERDFPDLKNPVQMSFDNRGRLWVAVIPSYPHYVPGGARPNDKLLILEDTDKDGRADKQTVFADGLSLPIGFELAPEGVYVSEEPHLCLLVDEDKDDRADRKEILLSGFDTHDTHHAIHAFTSDASGAFYLSEGRFLHSQVETPYGPQRMADGGVWRFDPHQYRLERYSQADYNNPWGVSFDEWEQCFIADASSGQNWWALPLSAKMPHAVEIPKVGEFAPKRARPTSGSEFVSSRHFPEELQGHFMQCNSIGFLGTSLHQIWEDESGFSGKHIGDLLSSSDPNYRPVDLETAPDGSLYIVDWHNALIGHMQHSARDPNRDKDHGRIYRVTYPARPLVEPPAVAGASIATLLENLKLPEYRARYRTRRELRGRPANEVLPAVREWAEKLDRNDPNYERHLCEALWATWAQHSWDRALLEQCLTAKSHQARAAAVQVLSYERASFATVTRHPYGTVAERLKRAAGDPHGRVRLAAIVAASWLDNADGAAVVLEALKHPFDRWMGPVTELILKTTLADDLQTLQQQPGFTLEGNPNAQAYLAGTFKFAPPPKSDEEKSYGPTRALTEAEQKIYKLGKEIFHRDGHCGTCHQANGLGTPNIYPPLVAKDNPWVSQEEDRLIKIVLKGLWGPMELAGQTYDPTKGVPPMPGFGGMLRDEEVAAVISYVRQSFGNDLPLVSVEAVKKVRAATEPRQNFYMVDEIMKEHPIPGWEKWGKNKAPTAAN